MMPMWLKRDYRAVSYALCSCVFGVLFMRLIVWLAPLSSSTYGQYIASNAVFALPTQLLFFFAIPLCIYRFYTKRTFGQIVKFTSCGKFRPSYLLAIPLGLFVFVLTYCVSSAWMALLRSTGYVSASSTPSMPNNFNFGFFLAECILTAILPAVCEEFAMRGGLLTTARQSFKTVGCVIICGVIFGLFHQNVKQVLYTALFGAFAAFLTLRLKSIYPAMLMHFTNNFCSVYFNYARKYDFALGGGFYDAMYELLVARAWAVVLIAIAAAVLIGVIAFFMLYLHEKRVTDKKIDTLKDCAFDATNKRVVLMGEFDAERVEELEMQKEVYGAGYTESKFKPGPRDIMIAVALAVVTVCTTVFTYVWGFFY